ncbi:MULTISPECIES: cupin domain-containing protein [unclassified Gilliamella]|uniref:(R)-mandelonitrile lyase n=1 Tax=unclassified Gilliamella TaxID=2685620 RepID=UPI00226A3235|nr:MULTISPECIES: cupin domain-containing protein [unclassified Gilliamella]MCX8641776.1 cupin domain-containing protein [Gilliamella sp. B3835]MCX8706576.1 cupin domain-containing protein [Gilliamella sp. B3783]MCX8708955.1 cupin domain-containing protein [Gilliamella sp. B3780]MCX8712352.1 cupin domain-containing protein [Gilliamella sp. B3468]MCX8714453.1 cupin domain-containing protein [Gilliamella sp. B3781]
MRKLSITLLITTMIVTCFSIRIYAKENNAMSQKVTKNGTQASIKGSDKFFTGDVRIDPLFPATSPSRTSGAYVTFEPGARSAWHTHPLGQTLVVTSGVGFTQEWGGPIVEIHPGDVITCPPGVKHWHGASPHNAMTHLSVVEELDGKNVEWLEKVTDEQYYDKK